MLQNLFTYGGCVIDVEVIFPHRRAIHCVAMDLKFLRCFCLSLSLLLVAVFFLFPVDREHLIRSWQVRRHSSFISQNHAFHESASTHYPTELTPLSSNKSPFSSQNPSPEKRPLKVAIVESMGWHDEVYAAFVHAFGSQPDLQLSLFFENPRWGMPEVLKNFRLNASLPQYVYHDTRALDIAEPDIIVSTTCEYDIRNLIERLDALFEKKKTYLFCTAHYANEWNYRHEWLEPSLTKWVEAGLMTILTLSPHVQEGFHKAGWGLNRWGSLEMPSSATQTGERDERNKVTNTTTPWPPIEVFVPVFPVHDFKREAQGSGNSKEKVAFAIQGGVNAARNYTRIINYLEDLVHSESLSHLRNDVSLHIIGSDSEDSKLIVPASVSDHVFFDQDLDYIAYYTYLSEKSALIPAFAEEDFLTVKSSSSIPASVIAGIPLVATKDILRSYSYLTAEDVYVQEDHETELDVMTRIVKGSDKERRRKIARVASMRDRIIKNNINIIGGWIEEARSKVQR